MRPATIVALSSGAPPAGLAVIRCSGPDAQALVERLAGSLPAARRASVRVLRDREGAVIDEALVLWMPGPASFTGEDCAEFHVHGSRAVVSRLIDVLTDSDAVRLAEPGEFTRRAFVNGRIDLSAAEGLADLIRAETEAQRRYALLQADGSLRRLYDDWRRDLLECRALLEADIDFADEDDVPGSVADSVALRIAALKQSLASHLDDGRRSALLRDGFRIAIVGRPNVGKSSLLNRLAGSDLAIVSDEPGTTRDVIEARLDIGGHLVVISDTAGLRDTDNRIEAEGIRRALLQAADASLVLHLDDSDVYEPLACIDADKIVRIASKADQGDPDRLARDGVVALSTLTASGVDPLLEVIRRRMETEFSGNGFNGSMLVARERHVAKLRQALAELQLAEGLHAPVEIRAEALRMASSALAEITGAIGVEDVLGSIFSSFCIGK